MTALTALRDEADARCFVAMLRVVRRSLHPLSQKDFAAKLGISNQYLCDLEHGRRLPSVEVVNRICKYLGRGQLGRHAWHTAGAIAHGWEL